MKIRFVDNIGSLFLLNQKVVNDTKPKLIAAELIGVLHQVVKYTKERIVIGKIGSHVDLGLAEMTVII